LFVSVFLFFLVAIVITYLDDMIGKGLGFWTLTKLFFYAWITFIPQCIPLAVLLASIMTFGSLAENYELAALKSSGLSLFRIIKPVLVCVIFLGGFTFIFNNYIMPKVMLESHSLLYDIRQAKPALNVKEGIFYNKINNYSMRIGKRMKDGYTLHDIKIYDHTQRLGNTVQLYADSGYMRTSPDTTYLIITLINGNRYEELQPEDHNKFSKPLMALGFKELEVNIELTDFKMKRSDESGFKGHHEMMNIWQIKSEIDSCDKARQRRHESLAQQARNYFFYRTYNSGYKFDTAHVKVNDFLGKLSNDEYARVLDAALNNARSSSSFIDSVNEGVKSEIRKKNDFRIGWHEKINVCFACILLFFIGAPLGAIIRKGGMGLPVVVAVFFFLAFFILTETFKGLAMDGLLSPLVGMWGPLCLFLPLGIFLTYKAATDSALFEVEAYLAPFKKLMKRKSADAPAPDLQ